MAGELKSSYPDFFLLGAAKAGTTSLYHYLKQHPRITMSAIKEPKFFSLAGHPLDFSGPGDETIPEGTTTNVEEYLKLFADAPAGNLKGEASTIYLEDPEAAVRIHRANPQAKLIAVLRHPAERAYSAYLHLVRDGWETLSFEEALTAEAERKEKNYYLYWRYQERGYYGRSLTAYYRQFSAEQLKIFLYEELEKEPKRVLDDIFRFLGLSTDAPIDLSARHNQSGIPKNQALSNTLTRSHPIKNALKKIIPESLGHHVVSKLQSANIKRPSLNPETRKHLTESYREDIEILAELIQRDLSHWLI